MKKYVKLKCSACARQKDQLIDSAHYTPDRCTITLGCEGRLTPIGLTSDGSSTLSNPPTGTSNWYPRGSVVAKTSALKNDVLYDTSTGSKKQFVIAVSNDALNFIPSGQSSLKLELYIEQQTAKDYRQYTYRRSSPFTTINGVEDGQAKKVLRYTTSDEVQVYVNGVKRDAGIDYLLYDGTQSSAVPPNTVMFTTQITGANNQVDVIVTQASAVQTGTLMFQRAINDESRAGLGAWEGVDSVKTPAHGVWSVFYCDFSEISSTFALDVKLRLKELSIRQSDNDPWSPIQAACILLSRTKVHTPIDRQRAKWVPTYGLNTDTEYLVVKMVDGERSLLVTEGAALDVFPTLEVLRFGSHKLQTSSLAGNGDASELDNNLITGPDA